MEDLIGFLIVVVVALINLFSQMAKKKRGETPDKGARESKPRREPSSIEEFFENLAEKMDPRPVEMPDWPEGHERPDYVKEQEQFESTGPMEYGRQTAEIIPMPVQEHPEEPPPVEIPDIRLSMTSAPFKKSMASIPSTLTGVSNMRMSASSLLRSSPATGIRYSLNNRAELRKAILSNIIFSPPRAFDSSFENTIVE